MSNFIDEIKDLYGSNLKDEIRAAAKYGRRSIYYTTEDLDCDDIKKILGEGFKVKRMTYDTITISWEI
jgi:hypothetical protein